MKAIYWHAYELTPRHAPNARVRPEPRRGALLRAGDGFADLHPWPELGDEPLDRQLSLLAAGTPAAAGARSLQCATIDEEARRRGLSLFGTLKTPESHFTVPFGALPDWNAVRSAGFAIAKVKASGDSPIDVQGALEYGLRLRIDFNATGSERQIAQFLERIAPEAIDFIEDPTPYDARIWGELRERFGVRLAADREKHGQAFDVVVIKPALEETPRAERRELVFTSAMDHPLGQLWAAWNAARAAADGLPVGTCGLLTAHLYEPTEFSAQLRTEGPRLIPPGGTGLGFDDLLAKLDWRRLA